jgi:hypothetical protein
MHMPKKVKVPKVSEKEIQELTQACRYAFGSDDVDTFMDKVFAEARRLQELRKARGEQSRTE